MKRPAVLHGIETVAQIHLDWQGELEEKTLLVEALRLDSIRLLTLIAEVENHFKICFEDGDEMGLETIGDLIDIILERSK